ncbi:helix-turn-helix domain-containing protein [Cohnella massiliensis]|uniref:helix-turn-helix domain-containing protein n=1 Tax=Cohnella massiliensis TaxID=1816691 RepID=UPI0009BAB2EE
MNLGEKVRTIRKSHELNQKEFALKIGVSQGTLSDIERGVCLPSCETIIALKNTFQCDLNWCNRQDPLNNYCYTTLNSASLQKWFGGTSGDNYLHLIVSVKLSPPSFLAITVR